MCYAIFPLPTGICVIRRLSAPKGIERLTNSHNGLFFIPLCFGLVRLKCSENTAALLASYIVQGKFLHVVLLCHCMCLETNVLLTNPDIVIWPNKFLPI